MFYLIDKPIGMTSFDVIRILRKKLGKKKIGHTGTLDPLASGCLLIATENSTKLIHLLEKLEKTYTFKVDISGRTESLDLGTDVTYHDTSTIRHHTSEDLKMFLEGQAQQIPPKYSALNINGVRAYELARRGENIILKERDIRIRDVRILSYAPPQFEIQLRISSGGYIRSLAPIIGEFFGLPGGYITHLRRDALHLVGWDLRKEDAQNLEIFDPEKFISYETLFSDMVFREVSEAFYIHIQEGRPIYKSHLGGTWNIGQNIFIKYKDNTLSLLKYDGNGFQIIRNNI